MSPIARTWTLRRASNLGIIAGLGAFLAAILFDSWPGALLYPYAGLLAVTALCGASVLLITARDMRTRGTSQLMRPIRGFDIVIGLVLLLPAGYALAGIWPRLGL